MNDSTVIMYSHLKSYTTLHNNRYEKEFTYLRTYVAKHTTSYITTQLMICSFMNSKVEKQQYEDIAMYAFMSEA